MAEMERAQTAQTGNAEIDAITAEFFDAFTNCGGRAPEVDCLYNLFIPQAIIVKNTGGQPEVYDVAGFVEPRREILSNGTLTEFREAEVSERTQVYGRIAQRFSLYEKSWIANGKRYTGSGAKTIQFVLTPAGWRLASLVWDDDPQPPET